MVRMDLHVTAEVLAAQARSTAVKLQQASSILLCQGPAREASACVMVAERSSCSSCSAETKSKLRAVLCPEVRVWRTLALAMK